MSSRELILERLKNAASSPYYSKEILAPAAASPGNAELFMQQASAAGAQVERFADIAGVRAYLQELVKTSACKSMISSSEMIIKQLHLADLVADMEVTCLEASQLSSAAYREYVLHVDMGSSGCNYALADTGTIVISHPHNIERLISLAPDHHVCILLATQILADRFSLPAAFNHDLSAPHAAITLITGVSRTADVALQVVFGMHGPRRMNIIIIG